MVPSLVRRRRRGKRKPPRQIRVATPEMAAERPHRAEISTKYRSFPTNILQSGIAVATFAHSHTDATGDDH